MGYDSACVTDICKIFASIGGFSGMGIECCQSHFPTTDPLPWQRTLGQNWL